jgi:hypothetical protein
MKNVFALCFPTVHRPLERTVCDIAARSSDRRQRAPVDAKPLPPRRRAITKDMAEVASATPATDLGSGYSHPEVSMRLHVDLALGEARPARSRLELRPGAEQDRIAGGASVETVGVGNHILIGERRLSTPTPQDAELRRRERFAPGLLALHDFPFAIIVSAEALQEILSHSWMPSGARDEQACPPTSGIYRGRCGARTHDRLLVRQVLYQLS